MGNGVSGREGQTTPGRSDVVISDLLKRLVSDESEPPIEPYHPSASYGSLAGKWQHLYTLNAIGNEYWINNTPTAVVRLSNIERNKNASRCK